MTWPFEEALSTILVKAICGLLGDMCQVTPGRAKATAGFDQQQGPSQEVPGLILAVAEF